MKIIWFAWVALIIFLAGCTLPGGGKLSSEHGYGGSIKIDDFEADAFPTILPTGTEQLGYKKTETEEMNMFSTFSNDDVRATGPTADLWVEVERIKALTILCLAAPAAKECGRAPLP